MKLRIKAAVLIGIALSLTGHWQIAHAQTLVGNPFVSPYTNWDDTFPTRGGNWRLSLHNSTLMDTNNANPPVSGVANNSGLYEPDVLVADNFLAPDTYDVSARMRTNDDDIIGL